MLFVLKSLEEILTRLNNIKNICQKFQDSIIEISVIFLYVSFYILSTKVFKLLNFTFPNKIIYLKHMI